MSLISLLVALVAQSAWPPPDRRRLGALYGRLCLSTAKRLNAGDRNSGMLAYFALAAIVLAPVAILAWLAASIHPVVLAILNVVVLYASLSFLGTAAHVGGIERALREGDVRGAQQRLAAWQPEVTGLDDPGAIARLAAEQGLREAHHGTFAILFWFLLLPGPLGAVLYPLTLRAARLWALPVDPLEREFGWFAGRALAALDWAPQRATAFAFAVVGDFEDALYCWRSQAAQWLRPDEGIVLASGAGALGVRLGDPLAKDGLVIDRPALGTGEPAGEDALASLEGMLWRALVLWFLAYLLAAAIATF